MSHSAVGSLIWQPTSQIWSNRSQTWPDRATRPKIPPGHNCPYPVAVVPSPPSRRCLLYPVPPLPCCKCPSSPLPLNPAVPAARFNLGRLITRTPRFIVLNIYMYPSVGDVVPPPPPGHAPPRPRLGQPCPATSDRSGSTMALPHHGRPCRGGKRERGRGGRGGAGGVCGRIEGGRRGVSAAGRGNGVDEVAAGWAGADRGKVEVDHGRAAMG